MSETPALICNKIIVDVISLSGAKIRPFSQITLINKIKSP